MNVRFKKILSTLRLRQTIQSSCFLKNFAWEWI